jgi:hypothetical protein
LNEILELEPEILLIGYGEPIFGKENIKRQVAWTKKYIFLYFEIERKVLFESK